MFVHSDLSKMHMRRESGVHARDIREEAKWKEEKGKIKNYGMLSSRRVCVGLEAQ